jgi:hypothetical protein
LAGRLRQKLAEYYRTEGKDDPVVIDLPKGHFKLTWEPRPRIPETYRPRRQQWRRVALFLGFALLVTLVWAVRMNLALRNLREASVSSAIWTPELKQLWGPFIGTNHPLVVAVGPRFNFAARGDVDSSFRLGKLLGSGESRLSYPRTTFCSLAHKGRWMKNCLACH